jgi:hypothetical protein
MELIMQSISVGTFLCVIKPKEIRKDKNISSVSQWQTMKDPLPINVTVFWYCGHSSLIKKNGNRLPFRMTAVNAGDPFICLAITDDSR